MQISENFGYGAAIAAVFFEARRKAIARMGKKARFEAGSGSVLLGENSCSPAWTRGALYPLLFVQRKPVAEVRQTVAGGKKRKKAERRAEYGFF